MNNHNIPPLPYDWKRAHWIDFDGTITLDEAYPNMPTTPNPYVVKAMRKAHADGMYLIIHSCRMTPPNDIEAQRKIIFDFCLTHDIPYSVIWDDRGKPITISGADNRVESPNNWAWLILNGWFDRTERDEDSGGDNSEIDGENEEEDNE